jgi:hypothetical protein
MASYSQEPLAHIYDRLNRRGTRRLIDHGPEPQISSLGFNSIPLADTDHTSCFWLATRLAGRKGSLIAVKAKCWAWKCWACWDAKLGFVRDAVGLGVMDMNGRDDARCL